MLCIGFRNAKILVKIICYSPVSVYFIAIPLSRRADIQMRILVTTCDVGDSSKAQILSLTAYRLAADWLPVLPVTADIRSSAFGMLTAACTANRLVMLWAAVATCHDDFTAIQGGIKRFQLVDQFRCK